MSPNTDLNYFVFILAKLYCEMRHANYLDLCVSIFESQKKYVEKKGPIIYFFRETYAEFLDLAGSLMEYFLEGIATLAQIRI